MRKVLKILIAFIFGNPISFRLFRYLNRKKLTILAYHNVLERVDKVDANKPYMFVEKQEFENQMKILREFYVPISEEKIVSSIKTKKSWPNYSIWVTFDDGYRNNYENAWPILKKYKVPATFFIVTGKVFSGGGVEGEQRNYMSWDEIKKMRDNAFSFGAHSVSHRILSSLSEKDLEIEIKQSKRECDEKLNNPVVSFAYPYGKSKHYNRGSCNSLLKKNNFLMAVTTVGGNNSANLINEGWYELRRITVSVDDNIGIFKAKICTGCFWQK